MHAGCEHSPQTPQCSRSSARIDLTSGKRDVTLKSNGVGWLIMRTQQLNAVCCPGRDHSHDQPYIHKAVRVWKYLVSFLVFRALKINRPQSPRHVDEQGLVGEGDSHAIPPPETVRRVPFLVRIHRPRRQLSALVQESFRPEFVRILAIYCAVVVALPNVRYARRTLWNVHPFVPVFDCRDVRYSERCNRSPANRLLDYGMYVWQVRCVGEGREAITADDG